MAHILLIDDDKELTSLLNDLLSFEGFTVSEAHDGMAGLEAMNESVDLILLDIMMPRLNGMDMLRKLREQWQTPVLFLTAKGDEWDRVIGLELGADDFLPKPFNDRELLARIRAILRRSLSQDKQVHGRGESLTYSDIHIHSGAQEVTCQDKLIDLTSTEFTLLEKFIKSAGSIVTKEELSIDVLGKRLAPFDRAIDMHVSNLRKKLPERIDGKPRIKTLRGRGYLWVEV